jgi:hypothetical protein
MDVCGCFGVQALQQLQQTLEQPGRQPRIQQYPEVRKPSLERQDSIQARAEAANSASLCSPGWVLSSSATGGAATSPAKKEPSGQIRSPVRQSSVS